jgi:hypothetical protein
MQCKQCFKASNAYKSSKFKGNTMTINMTNALEKTVNTNTNEVRVCYEDSDATHVYYVRNIEFEDYEELTALEEALNSTSFGRGKFTVDADMLGYCKITYACNGMYGEANTDFAIDLEEKLSVFFE